MECNALNQLAIMRLSAIGDLILCSAAIHHLNQSLPETQITWFTSPLCIELFKPLTRAANLNIMPCIKPNGIRHYWQFYNKHSTHQFDLLLAMQASLRINLMYPLIRANRKLGFDKIRGRDGHSLFINEAIPYREEHILDGFLQFLDSCGVKPPDTISWPIEIPDELKQHTIQRFNPEIPWIALNPCTSKPERNWPLDRYIALVNELLHNNSSIQIVLTGGSSHTERSWTGQLVRQVNSTRVHNMTGQTSLLQLAALLSCCTCVISPDTAAVHLARALNVPVVGLYAVARPELTGPYRQLDFCVNAYPEAVERYLNKDFSQVGWHTRVHHPDAMRLIQLKAVLAQTERAARGIIPRQIENKGLN